MWNPFHIGGFERRLVVSFLLLSVIPVVIIALISTRYFMKSVQLVSNSAVEQSFRNSMEIARDFSIKLEEDASCAATRLADALESKHEVTTQDLLAIMKIVSEETHVDFASVYDLESPVWKLRLSCPPAVPRVENTIEAGSVLGTSPPQTSPPQARQLEARRITLKDPDVIASGVVSDNTLVVAGFTLDAGFADKMRRTGDDLGRYQSVGLYVSVLRRYIIIVTCVLVVAMAISATLVSRLLARRISQPITELAHATTEIARGDLEYRVTVKARDEVLSLVEGFNKMTAELEENKKNLIAAATREAQVARDFEIARQVQESLFPTALPVIRGWQFAGICRTARVVGGDYYDIFEVAPGKVLIAQGDVSGKGIGASLTMASIHAIVRSSGLPSGDVNPSEMPSRLVEKLNRYILASRTPEMFVTLFLGILDCGNDTLWYVNCGHPPAMVLRSPEGTPTVLDIGGTVLGITDRVAYDVGRTKIEAGETLVLFSDGVTEAANPGGEMFGEVRIGSVLGESRDRGAADTMQNMLGAVEEFIGGAEQADDISILVLRRTA
jgi:serine phosphatase RsbU (regulator of sigma subunit)